MADSHLDRIAAVGVALRAALAANVIPHSEISHAAALASVVNRGGALSVRQARTAHRVLSRSNLAAAGIELPAEPEPEAPAAAPHVRQDMPVLRILSDGKIGATAPYEFKDVFKRLGGKPSKEGRAWVWRFAATPTNAANLVSALEGSRAQVSNRVAALAAEHHRKGDLLALLDESAPLPEFATAGLIKPEFSLWDHQRRSVEFGSHASASLHAIPMGGGKTLATIATVNRTEGKRVVIVCPNKVRGVWPREVRKFSAQVASSED